MTKREMTAMAERKLMRRGFLPGDAQKNWSVSADKAKFVVSAI